MFTSEGVFPEVMSVESQPLGMDALATVNARGEPPDVTLNFWGAGCAAPICEVKVNGWFGVTIKLCAAVTFSVT
jgi:hypothetical protein